MELTKSQRKRAKRKQREAEGLGGRRTRSRTRDPVRYAHFGLRMKVLERDSFLCRYCGTLLDSRTANIDHVFPWKYGGRTSIENLVTCCRACNKKKKNSRGIRPKRLEHAPGRDSWWETLTWTQQQEYLALKILARR